MRWRKRNLSRPELDVPPPSASGRWWRRGIAWMGAAVAVVLATVWAMGREAPPVVYGYEVVNVFPHDPDAYTQGLVYDDGWLYEGTGLYGRSALRKVELATGRVVQEVRLTDQYFGEGITTYQDQVIQLTWRNEVGLVYDKQTLAYQSRFRYTGQGWGLTHDGENLILSDGTSTLRFLDPKTYRVVKRLMVRSQGRRISQLNELEYIDGLIFSNIWHSDSIACISPRSGEVTAWIDLKDLLPRDQRPDPEAVLNGIAYDSEAKRLFVTGKNWPHLFEIRLKAR